MYAIYGVWGSNVKGQRSYGTVHRMVYGTGLCHIWEVPYAIYGDFIQIALGLPFGILLGQSAIFGRLFAWEGTHLDLCYRGTSGPSHVRNLIHA